MKRAVAGIAMGLMLDTDSGSFIVLSDIMGTEDALGDMDLKVYPLCFSVGNLAPRLLEAWMLSVRFRWMSRSAA